MNHLHTFLYPGTLCSLVCGVFPALEVLPRAVLIPGRGGGRQESSNYTNQALFACVEVREGEGGGGRKEGEEGRKGR